MTEESAGTPTPDVSVVVVSYNVMDWLPRCLGSIGERTAAGRLVETIVVDNASSAPQVREYLAGHPFGIRLLQLEANIGFGRACNAGFAASRGRYVLLLNPDASVRPDAIDALVDFHQEDPQRGIVGGRTLRPDLTLDPRSCWGRPTLWSWFCAAVGLSAIARGSRWFDPESLGTYARDAPREVDIVTGCLLLADRSTWERLGGFDPQFFMYGEDADLSLRAHRHGLRPSITPVAEAIHAVGLSSPNRVAKQRLLLRGKATLARRLWSGPSLRLALGLLVLGVGLRAAADRMTGRETGAQQLWRERAEWSAGWPAPVGDDPPPAVLEPTQRAV